MEEQYKQFEKVNLVKISDFEQFQTVGKGKFSRVRLCIYKKNNKIYVMKIIKKNEIIKENKVVQVFREFNHLSILNHPFIVKLMGLDFEDQRYLYFILEYIPGGDLFTLLRIKGLFPIEQSKFYIAQIITIFQYLHGKNIIFRDLKPENLLINKNGYLKLINFGFSKHLENDNDKTYTLCGTPEYLAPEIILNKGHGKGVDWWATGILLYEMLVGIDPFNDDDPILIYEKILKGKIIFPKNIDTNAKSLIKHLLVGDSTKRYGCLKNGVKDILNHSLFNDFDWDNLVFLKMDAPYIPQIKSDTDTSNFETYPDSDKESPIVEKNNDPFLKW